MRDYLRQKVLEHKDDIANAIRAAVRARQSETASHVLNSKRGTITGEGSVTGSYILGTVQIAKGSHLSNSIVDDSVTLIIDEDVNITDCSFHGYLLPSKSECAPATIHIKKGCAIGKVWVSMSVEIGENSSILWACINTNRQDFETADQPSPTIIGANSVIYEGLLDAENYYREDKEIGHGGCTVGANLFMLNGILESEGGQMNIGDNLVIGDYAAMWSLIRGKTSISLADQTDAALMDVLRNRIDNWDGLKSFRTNVNIGNNGGIFISISLSPAYEKLKDPSTFTIGDNFVIITGHTAHHSSSIPSIMAHSFKVGNNVTLCVTGDGWYANNCPYRTVDIGDNSLIRLQVRRDGQLLGPDVKAPRDAVVVL